MGYYPLKDRKVQTNNAGAWCYAHELTLKLPNKQNARAMKERASNAGEENQEAL